MSRPFTDSRPTRAGDSYDPYLAGLRSCRPLPREELSAAIADYMKTRSAALEARLVTANLRLVVKIVHEYVKPWDRHRMDLIQEGNLGLLEGIRRFDPSRGTQLSSYAALWIRAYILRSIMFNWRLVKVGSSRSQREAFFHMKGHPRQSDRGWDDGRLLAEHLHHPEISIHASNSSPDFPSLEQSLEGPEEFRPDVIVELKELHEWFVREQVGYLKGIDGRGRRIMKSRHFGEEKKTLESLGAELGVTRERVRQLEGKHLAQFIAAARAHFDHELALAA